jgi:hypothetical protein
MPGGYVVRDANGQALAYLYCAAFRNLMSTPPISAI